MWFAAAQKQGIEIRYQTAATRLVQNSQGRVCGVIVRGREGIHQISARTIVL
jgi:tricarballylate dehydrogenase